MCPVNDMINIRFKVIVCTACKKVNDGEDPEDSSKEDWMDGVYHPPWSVGYNHIQKIEHSYQKMAGKVFKVKVVSLWGV